MSEQSPQLTLTAKVLRRIDEIAPQSSDGTVAAYSVDEFLQEATAQLIGIAPLHMLPITDFTKATIMPNEDGSGCVELPVGFVRLVEFKMDGWSRPATRTIDIAHPRYAWQFNRATRGGIVKPVVALNGDKLEYYSLPTKEAHKIVAAKCITTIEPNDVPSALVDVLCWITAALMLEVQNEGQAATLARQRATEIITTLYSHTK